MARNFHEVLLNRIPDYYLDRILPSYIVWLGSKFANYSLHNDTNLIVAFHTYNSVLIVGSAFIWIRICGVLNLNIKVAYLGAIGLFINWLVLKQYLYFAIQTDVTAYTLGILASLFIVQKKWVALILTAFVASFAFKGVLPLTALIILFNGPIKTTKPNKLDAIFAIVITLTVMIFTAYALWGLKFDLIAGADKVSFAPIFLSFVISGFYVFYIVYSATFSKLLSWKPTLSVKLILFFLLILTIRFLILQELFNNFGTAKSILDVRTYILGIVVTAVAKPGVFIIAHFVTFGPCFLLILYYLRGVIEVSSENCIGISFLIFSTMALLLNSESRMLAFTFPILITYLCSYLNNEDISKKFLLIFFILSIVISRFYFPLNYFGMDLITKGELTNIGSLLEFPWQMFFMNIGPYMGWMGYIFNLGLLFFTLVILFFSSLKNNHRQG